MLENRQHDYMIEVPRRKRQWRAQICANAVPSSAKLFIQLIIHAGAKRDAICRIFKESRFQSAAKVTHTGIIPNVRIRRSKTHPRNESVDSGVSHYLRR